MWFATKLKLWCVICHQPSLQQSRKKWTICLDYPRYSSEIELWFVTVRPILSYDWLEFRHLDKSCAWFYPAADSSSGGWIRVAANSILLLTSVSAAGYKLHLIPSHSWFEFQRLDRSCGRFHCTADLSSSGWMWVVTDSILRLFWVLATWYKLWLTLSCGWLESGWLDTSYSWFHPAANCELRLILSNGWLKICQLNSTRGLLIRWYMQQI